MAIQSAREPIRRHLTTHDFRGMGEAGLLSEDDRIELTLPGAGSARPPCYEAVVDAA